MSHFWLAEVLRSVSFQVCLPRSHQRARLLGEGCPRSLSPARHRVIFLHQCWVDRSALWHQRCGSGCILQWNSDVISALGSAWYLWQYCHHWVCWYVLFASCIECVYWTQTELWQLSGHHIFCLYFGMLLVDYDFWFVTYNWKHFYTLYGNYGFSVRIMCYCCVHCGVLLLICW